MWLWRCLNLFRRGIRNTYVVVCGDYVYVSLWLETETVVRCYQVGILIDFGIQEFNIKMLIHTFDNSCTPKTELEIVIWVLLFS